MTENSPSNISINVIFFAALREQLDCGGLSLELSLNDNNSAPASALTVKNVLDALINEHPQWQTALESSRILMAVNHDMVDDSALVKHGDEVAFFPPVTGG